MTLSRVGRVVAVVVTFVCLAATAAHAQFYDDARRSLGLGPDPLARSPRMVGMGRLTLVVDDVHLRDDVWEFTGNPAGLMDSDSVSDFELSPATAANSTVHDEPAGTATRERQDFALREFRTSYEALRHNHDGASFGLLGEFSRLRTDAPLSIDSEERAQFMMPRTTFVIAGKMPFVGGERVRYGLAIAHRYESQDDDALSIVSNAAGDYIDQDGTTLTPPVSLTPTHYGIRSLGGRAGLLLKATSWLNVAGGFDYLGHAIEGTNDAPRNTSETREDRPYRTYSVTAAGHPSGQLQFIGDARSWSTGTTDQRWAASFSTGTGSPPVSGRGLLQRRTEKGHEFRGRASWTQGSLTLAAGGSAFRREASTTVPAVDDRTSFNYFLNMLSARPGADSLNLPDSIRANASTETGSEYGVGAGIVLPWRRALLGVEYHGQKSNLDQLVSGQGPALEDWDVRVGVELPVNDIVRVRGGYGYRWLDADRHVAQDEYVSSSVAGGVSYQPRHAAWAFDSGYLVRWGKADYGDPTRLRSSEQSGQFRIRWVF